MSLSAPPEIELDGASLWYLYLVKCRNGSLYTGITTNVDRRFAEHQESGPKSAKYLRGKGPLELVYASEAGDRSQASAIEYKVKQLPREAKQRMIEGQASLLELVKEQR
jgi:putative endonuclease